MLRLALTRRWLAALAVCLLVATGCVRAAFWQWSRYEERTAINAQVAAAAATPPVPVEQLTQVERPVDPSDQWRQVRAQGRYDVDRTMLVRNRPLNGQNGFHVLVPLVTEAGTALLVDRGWVPAAASATASPETPAPPSGQVTVTARLRPAEPGPAGSSDLPAGQIRRIAVDELAQQLPYPVLPSYGERVREQPAPAQAPETLPVPQENAAQNFGYTIQWALFALIALAGWVVLVRREAADLADVAREQDPSEGAEGARTSPAPQLRVDRQSPVPAPATRRGRAG